MYTSTNIQSVLITDRMWETTCKWLEKSGVVVKNTENGSIDWGNYQNASVTGITEYSPHGNYGASWTTISSTTKPTSGSTNADYMWLLKTGHTEYTNRKNIYDLAGNLWEWTNSKSSSNSSNYALRGGDYNDYGANYPAVYRHNYSNIAYSVFSFRVGLFIQ